MNVVADKYLFEVQEMMPDTATLQLFDPREGFPTGLSGTDALLIRTVLPIRSKTISRLPASLKFIGTGSAGTDHVDVNALKQKGIAFANAAGCNARSVAEYVATALTIWADQRGVDLQTKTIGIVGVGNVGSALKKLLHTLNINTLCYDPPRQEREQPFTSCTLKEVLAADILTFHTPLKTSGNDATYHWLDESKLQNRRFDVIINTARGGVVHEQALLKAKTNNTVGDFIIDVWENEPLFNDELARNAFICTPHIAGYSVEAKRHASSIIIKAMCAHLSIPFCTSPAKSSTPFVAFSKTEMKQLSLKEILAKIHPVFEYQKRLKALIAKDETIKRPAFNLLRSDYPLRNEYAATQITKEMGQHFPVLLGLGIQCK